MAGMRLGLVFGAHNLFAPHRMVKKIKDVASKQTPCLKSGSCECVDLENTPAAKTLGIKGKQAPPLICPSVPGGPKEPVLYLHCDDADNLGEHTCSLHKL